MSGNVIELRKTTPTEDSTVAKALRFLRLDLMRSSAGKEPTALETVQAAIRLCVKVDRAAASDRPREFGNSMPDYLPDDMEEREAAAKQRMIDYTAGDLVEVEAVNAAEVTAAEAIERVFRAHLAGEDQARAWKILFLLAAKRGNGLGVHEEQDGSVRNVAKKVNLSAKRVRDIRDRQLQATAKGISHLIPAPQYCTGVIHQAA